MKAYLSVILAVFIMAGIVTAASCGGATVCHCGDVLTSSYTMTSDLTNSTGGTICANTSISVPGLTVSANNIVLDCAGHKLTGNGNSGGYGFGYGINLTGVSGDTIKNCIVDNFNVGIGLVSSPNNTLTGNTANSNLDGIWLYSSSNNNLTGNTANSNVNYGIWLQYFSNNNTLTGNTANSNVIGIFASGTSSNNNLTSNTASSNQYGIYLSYSSNNTLTSNIASSNTQYGFYLWAFSNNTFTSNTANSNVAYGIYMGSSSNYNTITNNTANSNEYGIYLSTSSYNAIYNNYFNNSVNAKDDGTNSWNTTKTPGTNIIGGSYIGGNFWSDYTGADTSSPADGIGDTLLPYNSGGHIANGGDYLPLTTQFTIHCGDTLTSSYNMTSDLAGCSNGLTIGAINIVLDCQGHTLSGNNNGEGVYLAGTSGNIIKNCIITNFDDGIYAYSSSNNNFINNTANSNVNYGIWLYSSSNNTLTNNTANSNNINGIYLFSSSNNTLTNNTANSNVYYGIVLDSSSNNTLTGNTAANSNQYGIVVEYSPYNTLTNNTANSNSVTGIDLSYSSNNTLTGNTANSNPSVGILLSSSNNNTLTGNTANSNDFGIYLSSYSNNNTLTGNTANSNGDYGISLDYSSNNTLTGNTAKSDGSGIYAQYSSYNTLTNNTANSNYPYGIYLWASPDNNLTSNIVNSNTYGIYLISGSTGNLIYNNYFNNSINAYDGGINYWNTTKTLGTNIIGGSYIGGNFWSDYTGADTSSPADGIGDTLLPYTSSGNIATGGDYLPLVPITGAAPTVTWVSSDTMTYNIATPSPHTIKVIFSEDIVNTPTIAVSGSGLTVYDCGDVDAMTWCADYSIPSSTEATMTVQISGAQDVVGNTMVEDDSHTFAVDTIAPVITIYNPDISPAQNKTLTASTSDGTLTMSVTTGDICNGSLTFEAYTSRTFTYESDNGIKICYKAVDAAGNIDYNMSNPIAGIDRTAPALSITAPTASTNVIGTATVSFTDSETTAPECSIDNTNWVSCTSGVTTLSGITGFNALPDGSFTLYVSDTDTAGNTGTASESLNKSTLECTSHTDCSPGTTFCGASNTCVPALSEGQTCNSSVVCPQCSCSGDVCSSGQYTYDIDGKMYCTNADGDCVHLGQLYAPEEYVYLSDKQNVYFCGQTPGVFKEWTSPVCAEGYIWNATKYPGPDWSSGELPTDGCIPILTPAPEFPALIIPIVIGIAASAFGYFITRKMR